VDDTRPQSKSILVVDDDETICAYFEVLLSKEGFNVFTLMSGKTALDRLKARAFRKIDLVILDLMMPAPGGYEVLKELQNPDYQDVPIFIVTARALDPGSVSMLRLESNVKEFWKKPIDPAEFRKKLHDTLGTVPPSTPASAPRDPYGPA